jgi:hypothetical protein
MECSVPELLTRAGGGAVPVKGPGVRATARVQEPAPVLRRRDRPVKDGQSHEHLLSGNSPTDRKMADAHHLDALVVRQLLTDGGLRDESLMALMNGSANSSGTCNTWTALSRLHSRKSGVRVSEQTRMRAVSISEILSRYLTHTRSRRLLE